MLCLRSRNNLILVIGLAFLLLVLCSWSAPISREFSDAQQAVELSDTARLRVLLEEGRHLSHQEHWRESLLPLHEAYDLAQRLHHTDMHLEVSNCLYNSYYELGALDTAAIYADQLLTLARQIKDVKWEMSAWNKKAILYSTNLAQESAYEAYQKAYALAILLNDTKSQVAFSSNMGIIFGQQRQYDKARAYFRKALDIGRLTSDSSLITLGAMNISRAFTEEQQFDSAGLYIGLAHEASLAIMNDDPAHYYGVIDFQGLLALKKGELELAEIRYKRLEHIYSKNQQVVNLAEVHSRLAEVSMARKNYQQAIDLAKSCLDLLQGVPAEEVRESALLILNQAYSKLGDFEDAFEYGERYRRLRDSSYNQEVTRLTAEMASQFELSQKERENDELAEEARHQKEVARQRTIIALTSGIAVLVIFSLLLFFFQKNRHRRQMNKKLEATVEDRTAQLQSTNLKLQKYNEELRTFGHITSHDLKEPLRNISGFARLLEKRLGANLDEENREFLSYIKQNTAQMHELIEDILVYSTLDDRPIKFREVDLMTVMTKVKNSLCTLIEEQHGQIIYKELPTILSNDGQLFMILKNLVENGLKYNESAVPRVEITYSAGGRCHQIFVRDNGIGITQEYHEQIFQSLKRLHNRKEYSGTGMGLAISRKIAIRLGGDVQVRNSGENGSLFLLTLPIV